MTVELQDSAGAAAVPGSFKVVGQRPNILIQGGSQVVEAMTIDVQETLYGIFFSFTIPRTQWAGDGTQAEANFYTSTVQAIAAAPEVIAVSYAQDVNAAGALIDTLIVTVETPDGLNTAVVTLPLLTANTPASFAKIAAAVATLTSTAGLS